MISDHNQKYIIGNVELERNEFIENVQVTRRL